MKIIIIALVIVAVCFFIAKAFALIELDPKIESSIPKPAPWYFSLHGSGEHNGQDANNCWGVDEINLAALKDGDVLIYKK